MIASSPVEENLLTWEPVLRGGVFVGFLVLLMVLEAVAPRRARSLARWHRWPANLGLVAVNTGLLRLLTLALPLLPVAVALKAQTSGWGLFSVMESPRWLTFTGSVVLLDLTVWAQHLAFHKIAPLWRLHRVHHADQDIDVTTGARFHPAEIALSLIVKLAAIVILGAPPAAVLVFEVLLNATAMFNHANLTLPRPADRLLRMVVVTPDMHRVHHSWRRDETDSNYGFNFPWWDHLFGTYRAQPRDGHDGMTIGLPLFRTVADQSLRSMLVQPLRSTAESTETTSPQGPI